MHKEAPMKYYDQHVHSNFSFDSGTELSDYLKYAKGYLVTTEHVDLENSANGFQDSWMDYERYSTYLKTLQKQTDIRLLRGVEIGWLPRHHAQLMAWLQNKQFDIILLSIHQNGSFDYMDEEARQHEISYILHSYFQQMLAAVQSDLPANVLSHFDYVSRIQDVDTDTFLAIAHPYMEQIFPEMIKRSIALELNTRSMFQYGQLPLYETVVDWYKQLGGAMFTMSSDAHKAEAYAFHFHEGREFLRRHDISKLTVFQEGKPYMINWE